MLEFQEGFFEHEIRDNFYVDATMKAVWAAEMEVLQRIAEVCDRHGIIWYAAYGTLLGAIRHEGFVPWDDDLDIWVMRSDYNRLIQILARELPEGYNVRNPMYGEGYDEFHTCVSNGSRISVNKEWLEQYHGCPFSVGMDIFPLDYLPREEKMRAVQEGLFSVAMSCAQSAASLERGRKQMAAEDKQAAIERICDGIRYLEENAGVQIDGQLIQSENWEKAASDLWRCANYIAMMYGEEECDYLVCYMDYARQPQKKFPKEWFTEVYSATFENFMLPVPGGYDQILRQIYGDYQVRRRGGATHDYPFYERQLEELYTLVKSMQAADHNGEEEILPTGWKQLLNAEKDMRKKIVLYTNDISDFITYGKEALDKLESALQIFYESRERILLWWRPQEEMPGALLLAEQMTDQPDLSADSTVEQSLAKRYNAILTGYKAAGWGVCDESNDKLRAVEVCDAYYGPSNSLMGKFQDGGKPVMVASGR